MVRFTLERLQTAGEGWTWAGWEAKSHIRNWHRSIGDLGQRERQTRTALKMGGWWTEWEVTDNAQIKITLLMKQWLQYSSNNELLGRLPQLPGFAPHTHSVLWSTKHPKVPEDGFWVPRYPVTACFLRSVTFINFQSDCPQIKQWVTFRWNSDLLSPLVTSLLDIELERAHFDCVWFVF